MPSKTRLRTSTSSHDSPDPLALSENGIQRATSPTKFSPFKTGSPNRQKKQQLQITPQKSRSSDPFLEESRTKSVTSHSISQPGSGSPWKIRVTVEAEPEDQDGPANSPLRRKSNVLTRDTVTTTVPLRDADGGTPARRRGRPAKSSPMVDSNTKRKRPSTPAKRSPASNSEEGMHTVMQEEEHSGVELPEQVNKRRRGKTRKSEAQEIASAAMLQEDTPPSKNVVQIYDSRVDRNSDDTNEVAATDVALSAERNSTQAPASKTLAERLLAEDDTTALDLSAIESEGFSMVSIESLRSEKEKAARQERLKQTKNRLHTVSEAPVPHLQQSQKNQTEHHVRCETNEADARHEPDGLESEASGLGPDQLQNPRAKAIRSSFGFGEGTFKDLRARYMMGELLSRRDRGPDAALVEEDAVEHNATIHNAPKESPPYPRLPTPADSVEGDSSAYDKSVSGTRQKDSKTAGETFVKDYDEMSWIPTNQPKKALHDIPGSHEQMSWRANVSAEPHLARSNPSKKVAANTDTGIDENRFTAGTPQAREVAHTVGAESPIDVTMADDEDMWQAEAERSFEESKEGRQHALPKLPTKTPDWNDLLGEDNRPLRSKIPRSWRRASGDYFKYSDEIEGEETPHQSPERDLSQPVYNFDKYCSSEESTLEPDAEAPSESASLLYRAAAFINGSSFPIGIKSAQHETTTDTEQVVVEENSVSEVVPRQQQSLFDPAKMYGRLFSTPKTPVSRSSQVSETPGSFTSQASEQEEDSFTDISEEPSNTTISVKEEPRRSSTGPGLFTRVTSWFFGPSIPHGTIWDRNHYVMLDRFYRKDHAKSMLPPLPKALAIYIGTGRYNEDHDIEHIFTEHDMRTVYVFIQEAKNEGIPQVCDGRFLRPSESAKTDENGKPYPLRDQDGNLIRVKQLWDAEEVSHRVFTIWLGDLLRAQEEDETVEPDSSP